MRYFRSHSSPLLRPALASAPPAARSITHTLMPNIYAAACTRRPLTRYHREKRTNEHSLSTTQRWSTRDIFVLCSCSLFFYIRFGYCFHQCVRCVLSNVLLLLQYVCLHFLESALFWRRLFYKISYKCYTAGEMISALPSASRV
jgi:hypothetical protein